MRCFRRKPGCDWRRNHDRSRAHLVHSNEVAREARGFSIAQQEERTAQQAEGRGRGQTEAGSLKQSDPRKSRQGTVTCRGARPGRPAAAGHAGETRVE